MNLKLIACDVLLREFCAAIAASPHRIDPEFLPKGLHDIGSTGMRDRLQRAIDAVDAASYDAILLGYGLCSNGIVGLKCPEVPLVIPKAHDCMTLFFGSKEAYQRYFDENPGTYFLTSGWVEREEPTGELRQLSIQHQMGMDLSYDELVARFGEDNAKFLQQELKGKHYRRITFLRMGIEPDDRFERAAEERARTRDLTFTATDGQLTLFHELVGGEWSEDSFLVVPPGSIVTASYDGNIIAAEMP